MDTYKTFGAILTIVVIATAFVALLSEFSVLTSAANTSQANTTSNVTISSYYAIGLSSELATGIQFGNVEPNTDDNNATKDYSGGSSETEYYVILFGDSNTNVNVSISDNETLRSGGNTIPNTGYTWNASVNSTDVDIPGLPGTAITTTADPAAGGMTPGQNAYFRFWLDIPGNQAAGTYQNKVIFDAVPAE